MTVTPSAEVPTVQIGGRTVPALGQGTWNMGDRPARRAEELAALRLGLDLGMNVIDTAEMYGDGASETLVGEAIRGRRDEVYLVSKVLPGHADVRGVRRSAEASLRRLGTGHLDLYLLHWRGRVPLSETVAGMEALKGAGLIRAWGVSNCSSGDLRELAALPGGEHAVTDQVLYNLTRRGPEFDLLPECRARGMTVMAYSPVEQGRLLRSPALGGLARELGATPAQVALAWTLRAGGVLAIPKAASVPHVRENRAALDLHLSAEALSTLDAAFPPPQKATPLEVL